MSNTSLIIETHNFEEAKAGLKRFSEKAPQKLTITKVNEKKDVKEFLTGLLKHEGIGRDHKVTGEEFNNLIGQIQKHLIKINNMHLDFVNEIGRVYTALEALDNDYIKAIVISIKATEETSEGLKIAQNRIDEIVKGQSITLEVLKKHKQKLDEYNHLHDVDKLWEQHQELYSKTMRLADDISEIAQILSKQVLKNEEHDHQIENIIEQLNFLSENINNIKTGLQTIDAVLSEFKAIEHLKDIDDIWDKTERSIEKIEVNENKINKISETIQNNQETTEKIISEIEAKRDLEMKKMNNKIALLYLLAGGSLGISIIELILILLK